MEVRLPPDGAFRVWLPAGEYTVKFSSFGTNATLGASARTIKAGQLDLGATTLKSDGRAPIEEILITLQ
jgi:hypothetical protein